MEAGANSAYVHRSHGVEAAEEHPSSPTEDVGLMFARRGCCCFWIPFSSGGTPSPGRVRGTWERIGGGGALVEASAAPPDGPWWQRAMKKVREWSEIVAGPRWKTFIRRFRRNRHHRWASGGGGGAKQGKFQYDPLSYALNFEEGARGAQSSDTDVDYVLRNFSARYVMPPSSAKSSMDLGGRDAPPLFPAT